MSGQAIRSFSGMLAVAVVATACATSTAPTPARTAAPTTFASATLSPVMPTVGATTAFEQTATPQQTATPEQTASPRPTGTPAPAGPQPLRMGALPAGVYRTNTFEPQITFTLPDGWSEFFPDDDEGAYMGSSHAELAVGRADEVVDPDSHAAVEAPEDLLDWLVQHPAFGGPEPVAIEIGGVEAHYVDLPGPSADTKLFHYVEGDFHIPPGVATRIYVVPLEGQDVSVVVMPPPGKPTADAIEATDSIIELLDIDIPASPEPQALHMGNLTPGQYRTNRFEPALLLTLPATWQEFFPDENDEIYMAGTGAELAISVAAEVVDPDSRVAVAAPENLAKWLSQHPAFGASEPVDIEIGGIKSHYVDLPAPSADTGVFHFPGGDFHIPGVATRVYVVPLDGPDLSLFVMPSSSSGTIEDAIDATRPIIESLEIDR